MVRRLDVEDDDSDDAFPSPLVHSSLMQFFAIEVKEEKEDDEDDFETRGVAHNLLGSCETVNDSKLFAYNRWLIHK